MAKKSKPESALLEKARRGVAYWQTRTTDLAASVRGKKSSLAAHKVALEHEQKMIKLLEEQLPKDLKEANTAFSECGLADRTLLEAIKSEPSRMKEEKKVSEIKRLEARLAELKK